MCESKTQYEERLEASQWISPIWISQDITKDIIPSNSNQLQDNKVTLI